MAVLSAPGDTWGISGPDFLRVYLGAGLVFLVIAIAIRLSVTRAGGTGSGRTPSAPEVAFLVGGRTQAIYSSVAALRAAGAIGTGSGRALSATGPQPDGATPLDVAVYDAAQRGVAMGRLSNDYRVRTALGELQSRVATSGWLLDPSERARARLGSLLLLGLTGFGVVRIAAGVANDRPVGYLVGLAIVTLLLALVFFAAPRVSRAGRSVLAETRARNRHLALRQAPSWSTYGMAGAAMGVALYGAAALWVADPSFAASVGLHRAAAGSGGGDSGGGGCGGGGCGGGGCGG
jgi:uncharacterized protein (TIGR04222 family)